jgi:hypothetical protein
MGGIKTGFDGGKVQRLALEPREVVAALISAPRSLMSSGIAAQQGP